MTGPSTAEGRDRFPPPGEVGSRVIGSTRLNRRTGYAWAGVLLGALVGLALALLPPPLIIAGTIAVSASVIIMMRPFWGLLFYTVVFLLPPGEILPALSALHIERIVGAITLVGMFVAQYRNHGRLAIDGTKQTRLLLLFVFAVALSVPFAYWRGAALKSLYEMLKIAVFYLLFVHLVTTRRRLRVFVFTYLLVIAYIGGTALLDYLHGHSAFAQGVERAVGETSGADNPNELGTTMASTIPLLLVLATHRPLRWLRLIAAAAGLGLTTTMAVTGSRASLLGFLGMLGVLWWHSRRRIILGLVAIPLLFAAYSVLPVQYKARYRTITQSTLDGSSYSRVRTWLAGVRMVMDRPILGVGVGCFGTAHALGYSPEGRRSWLQAHSLYIQVPAEVGLIGAILFFSFLFEFLRLNRRMAGRLRSAGSEWQFESLLLKGVFAGLVALLLSGIFGHSMMRRTWYIYAAIGLCVFRLKRDEGPPASDRIPQASSDGRSAAGEADRR